MAGWKDRRLFDAVCTNNLDDVLRSLNEYMNLEDTFDDEERTPLIQACEINVTDIAIALIQYGANENARDKRGNTALMWASVRGNNSVATSLIHYEADINAVNKDGDTALNLACKSRQTKTAIILIENGANVNVRNNQNESPLRLAFNNNLTDVVVSLMRNGVCEDGNTALHLACKNEKGNLALILIQNDAKVNVRNNENRSPLSFACENNLINVVVSLIHNGADVNEVDENGNTALHLACKNGKNGMALVLIENHANVNVRNKANRSPLSFACENYLTKIVVSLLHNGADVNELDEDGNTFLNLACQNGERNMALTLIQNGANVSLPNKADRFALSFACENDLSDVVVSLIRNGAEVNETNGLNNDAALHYAAAKNHKSIIRNLLQSGADLNVLNKNGKTPLQLALQNQSTDAVEVIQSYAEKSANTIKLNPGQSSASNKPDDVVQTIKNVEKGLEKVNQKLLQFDKTFQTMLTRLEHLETKAKSNDQENFKNVLEIAGIESKENEDLDLILLRLATILGLSLQDKDNVISVHRPIKTSPATDSACAATNCSNVVEVKFRTFETTQNWLKAFQEKRSSGITSSALDPSLKSEKIFVNQKLTLYNKKLLHRAKELAKDKGYKFVWVQDGKILLRKDENSRVIRIKRDADLPT